MKQEQFKPKINDWEQFKAKINDQERFKPLNR